MCCRKWIWDKTKWTLIKKNYFKMKNLQLIRTNNRFSLWYWLPMKFFLGSSRQERRAKTSFREIKVWTSFLLCSSFVCVDSFSFKFFLNVLKLIQFIDAIHILISAAIACAFSVLVNLNMVFSSTKLENQMSMPRNNYCGQNVLRKCIHRLNIMLASLFKTWLPEVWNHLLLPPLPYQFCCV